MDELTIIRELRPGTWLAQAEHRRVLVREVGAERVATYRAAAELALPVPEILYVGADREGTRQLVVEATIGEGGAADPDAAAWRSLAGLGSLFRGCAARLVTALARAAEALAWLHAGGFVHGYLTTRTIHFHPGGAVCLTGLDCLQRVVAERLPCVAYSRLYPCLEQLDGWVSPATDVRLLGLAVAEAYVGGHPLDRDADPHVQAEVLARCAVTFDEDHPVLRLVERMCMVEPRDRPELREIVDEVRRSALGLSGPRQTASPTAV